MSTPFIPAYDVRLIPRNKHPLVPGPAQGAGVLALKCFINEKCPFVKTAKVHESMVFNERTLPKEVWGAFPENFQNLMTFTPGTEGIHFKSKYVYRHNYLVTFSDKNGLPVDLSGESDDAANTRYKKEHQWIVGVNPFLEPEGPLEEGCKVDALWRYAPYVTVESDSKQDYSLDYKEEYLDSDGYKGAGVKPMGDVQFVQQRGASGCDGQGVHWMVEKATPLFKGEDFFFHFKKLSKTSSTNNLVPLSMPLGSSYKALDFKNPVAEIGTEEDVELSPHRLSLSDQVYYVIEMGTVDPVHNYYIIICEREYPVFLRLNPLDNTDNVQILSYFNKERGGILGEDLINAKEFRVTVRNHLGYIIVQFDHLENQELKPWVIDRIDSEEIADEDGDIVIVSKKTFMQVPNGLLRLWGGNRKFAFNFGPLQYAAPDIEFVFPPRSGDIDDLSATISYKVGDNSIITLPKFFNLPSGVAHNIKLTATNEYVEDLLRRINTSIDNTGADYLFTHDAQFFKEGIEFGDDATDFKAGFFYYDYPLRQFADDSVGEVKDSSIELGKFPGSEVEDEASRLIRFLVSVKMQCGDHIFGDGLIASTSPADWVGRDYISDSDLDTVFPEENWKLSNCKTPIISSFRIESQTDNTSRWEDEVLSIDVSDNVLEYSENWAASDFHSLEHTGTIKFLLNPGMIVPENFYGALFDLQNRAFYVDIWAGYRDCNYTLLPGFYKLFTGICYGGEVTYEAGVSIMTCRVQDYTKVLEDQLFFNSPFYDGVYDIHAVKEIMDLAGFRSEGDVNPGSIIRYISDNRTDVEGEDHISGDGRYWIYQSYVLPSAYNRLDQPAFKFGDGSNYMEAIKKIAKQSGKLFYFDQHGFAHYEDYRDIVQSLALGTGSVQVLSYFTSNPALFPGQSIFNNLEQNFNVRDIYNHLKVVTNTPDQTPIIHDNLNWDSLDDPLQPGFVGYMKTFYQRAPIWGSQGAAQKINDFYRVMFKPAIEYSFETYGLPLRALDYIAVNGQVSRIMKIQHTLNAEQNKWWMKVECERYQPIDGGSSLLDSGEEEDE